METFKCWMHAALVITDYLSSVETKTYPFDMCTTNIPKSDSFNGFNHYQPISLCNYIYKLIAKVISKRLKPILYSNISPKYVGFLDNQNIHDAIGVSQESLHSIKSKSQRAFMLKINLSKAFDKLNLLYLCLILI